MLVHTVWIYEMSCVDLPTQDDLSDPRLYPLLQLHSKDSAVSVQIWLHPPLF